MKFIFSTTDKDNFLLFFPEIGQGLFATLISMTSKELNVRKLWSHLIYVMDYMYQNYHTRLPLSLKSYHIRVKRLQIRKHVSVT